jgi:ATP-dependent Lhr-like helicase
MPLASFHPAVAAWFGRRFGAPTAPQVRAWPPIRTGRHTLLAAPTGSGKTLAAFLAALDDLTRLAQDGALPDETRVVYVSPLKALSNDIRRNLEEPLAGIRGELRERGLPDAPIRALVRTGDTPARERAAMGRRPPHILVTTPESLYILLTGERGRALLRTARTLIVDEIHALAGNRRGAHLALSMERLQALAGRPLLRIGLSATQKPIDEVARFLVGAVRPAPGGGPSCDIIDIGHARDLDLGIELPASPLEAVMPGEVWEEIYDRLAALVRSHRTTLVFCNTRRTAERVARHLSDRLGAGQVAAHHGSLAREQRVQAEQRLKGGDLRVIVATASLELGIDIGSVECVCQLGSTRSIAALLQRIGRSGHAVGGYPKGRLFPLSRDELVEAAALLDAARRGELDALSVPRAPLDILAQQIVAEAACADWDEDGLYALARRAWPYRDLPRAEFDAVVRMLADGFTTRRGRRAAHLHHDAVNRRLRGRRGARLTAITSGGAIPDTADYAVVLEPSGLTVGTVNEDFAVESNAGDIFQLGNMSWRILRIEPGRVRVEDARGQPPRIPFWLGEAPARTAELSAAVSRLRGDVDRWLGGTDGREGPDGPDVPDRPGGDIEAAARRLVERIGLAPAAAAQIAAYLAAGRAALGAMPTQGTLVLERFFDESGGMQLVLHAPFGGRVNRAWGLALRKRFCRQFNFELQAAATEDAVVLSLGPTQSFPLAEVFRFLRPETARDILVQALLDAPVFGVRWRWNATRALAVPRFRGGRRTAPPIQRMLAEDLLALVFPDQLACAENLAGARDIPDHPLVQQTIRDCLEEATDAERFLEVLRAVESGRVRLVARDLTAPSPLAAEILGARPYAFLDDAPLEERRTQAVHGRRWLGPEAAADLGRLDGEAIERVRREARPAVADADELHDALVVHGFLTEAEGRAGDGVAGWERHLAELAAARRAATLRGGPGPVLWVAAERLPQIEAALPGRRLDPPIGAPASGAGRSWTAAAALAEILRGRLEMTGPVTAATLAADAGVPAAAAETALAALEAEGFVLRGRFTPAAGETEWCARHLLARIHRQTLDRLRREIEPVAAADFLRFLLDWQRVAPEQRARGAAGLLAIAAQLEGFEAPAAAWEEEILPARLETYDPAGLDALCLSGRLLWGRFSPPRPEPRPEPRPGRAPAPIRTTPIALLLRARLPEWGPLLRPPATPAGDGGTDGAPSAGARAVLDRLGRRGASFFDDLAAGAGLLGAQAEEALGELVARGLVTADGYTGLRALLTPSARRPGRAGRARRSAAVIGMEGAGRWTLLRVAAGGGAPPESALEGCARLLLRRYGVVFRRILDREGLAPPWRDLVGILRRLEARGEIRGGRFVDGFQGEQFALPEAVGALRAARRRERSGALVSVSAADPLNLIGVLTPGGRVPAASANRVLYRDGEPIAVREAGAVRFLADLPPAAAWQARHALLRRPDVPRLRAYLGAGPGRGGAPAPRPRPRAARRPGGAAAPET